MISNPDESWQRLVTYLNDLNRRLLAQERWSQRNPDINPFDIKQYTMELHESDPWPETRDILTIERFMDLITIAIAAFERTAP